MNTATASALEPLAHFGEPLLHADGDLLALAFAPDGVLCSVEEPGVMRRWNAHTGQQIDWQSLSDLETIWTFSRDARILASGSDDLTLWDASSGQVLTAIPQKAWITALTFAADSGFVATGHDDGVIRYWDAAGHHLVHEWQVHKKAISALAISPDGRLLAAAGEDKVISLFDVTTGEHKGFCKGHTDRIPALAWHPGGELLVSVGWDTTARVWNARTLEPVVLLNSHATQVTAVAFTADGSRLACADSSPAIHLWDFAARKELRVLAGPATEIPSLAFSPDGTRLAASGEFMIHLWDAATGQVLAGSGPRSLTPTRLAVFPDGGQLAINTGGGAPRVWDLATRQSQYNLAAEHPVHGLAVTGDNRRIAGAAEKSLRLWNTKTGKVVRDCEGPDEPITAVAASPNGQLLASASSTGIDVWVWRVEDGEPVLLIPDPLHNCTIETLAFHADSRRLAVGGIDWMATGGSSGGISVWDLQERCEIGVFPGGVTDIAFHPDGQRIAATSTDQSICIWDLASQELVAEWSVFDGAVGCLAYSPDGTWLATGGADRILRLWDKDGAEHAIHELDSQITDLAFSPDGRSLFVAHANTTCSQYLVAALIR